MESLITYIQNVILKANFSVKLVIPENSGIVVANASSLSYKSINLSGRRIVCYFKMLLQRV